MSRAWRVVLTVVVGILAAGIVLLGAAWVTGAAVWRIEELAFGGVGGLRIWLHGMLAEVRSLLASALETVRALL